MFKSRLNDSIVEKKEIKSIKTGWCRQSAPACFHEFTIFYSNGTQKTKPIYSDYVPAKYEPFLKDEKCRFNFISNSPPVVGESSYCQPSYERKKRI